MEKIYNIYNLAFISILFGLIWLLLIFVGHWFKKGKDSKAEFLNPAATKSLQGLAAFGVLCHHLSQTAAYGSLNQIQAFLEVGFLFVAVFFFCSGFGLIKSLNTKSGYLNGFLRHRLPTVIVPFYVMNLFYIVYHIAIGTKMGLSEWICKVTGVALLNDNAWFVPVIVILYLSFFLIFRAEKSDSKGARAKSFVLIFLVIAVQVGWFLFNKHFPWWLGKANWWRSNAAWATAPWWKTPVALWYEGEWWVNSTIAFLLGMLVAQYQEKFYAFFSKLYWVKLLASFLLFAGAMTLFFYVEHGLGINYWMEFGGNNKTLPRAILMGINALQSLSFCLLIALIMMKNFAENRVTRFLGNHSLEIYLMQALPLRAFAKVFKIEGDFGAKISVSMTTAVVYTLCVVASTLVLAVVLKFLSGLVLRLFKKKKN